MGLNREDIMRVVVYSYEIEIVLSHKLCILDPLPTKILVLDIVTILLKHKEL
jgi:hypothetical protein